MFPGYSKFTRAIALKQILRPADIPSYQLGVAPFEMLAPISHGRPVLAQISYRQVAAGGIIPGQSSFGVSGFGNLIPMVTPGDIPYYGPMSGGE